MSWLALFPSLARTLLLSLGFVLILDLKHCTWDQWVLRTWLSRNFRGPDLEWLLLLDVFLTRTLALILTWENTSVGLYFQRLSGWRSMKSEFRLIWIRTFPRVYRDRVYPRAWDSDVSVFAFELNLLSRLTIKEDSLVTDSRVLWVVMAGWLKLDRNLLDGEVELETGRSVLLLFVLLKDYSHLVRSLYRLL